MTTKNTHTPGSLSVNFEGPCPVIQSDAVGQGYYSAIASVTQRDPHPVHGGGITNEQARATATLFAAAPDLVAALEAEEEAQRYEAEFLSNHDNPFLAGTAETKRSIANSLRLSALSRARGEGGSHE